MAVRLGWRFLDVDQVIAERQGRSVAEVFAIDGEAAFRELEQAAIEQLLDEEQVVLALGGGALEASLTRERLLSKAGTYLIFLETPLAVALKRCRQQADGVERPVLAAEAELADRFLRRAEQYRVAHATIATEGRTPAELVTLVLARLLPEAAAGPGV